MDTSFENFLNPKQREIINALSTPIQIQAFLDGVPYSTEETNRTPLQVIQDRVAHCLDGALFAAAMLQRIGFSPLLLDMFPDPGTDDDHVLAIFIRNGHFGAIAKSNFPGLRFREAIHRSLRELVMTYFEPFFNVHGEKTLRTYTRLLNLKQFEKLFWTSNDDGVQAIETRLLTMKRYPLISTEMVNELSLVDHLAYQAGMLGVNPNGLFKPKN